MIDAIFNWGHGLVAASWWAEIGWPVIWALIKVVLVLAMVATVVTFTTLYERKLLGWVQIRLGPNRVGPDDEGDRFPCEGRQDFVLSWTGDDGHACHGSLGDGAF